MAEAPQKSTPPPVEQALWGGYTAGSGVVRRGGTDVDRLTQGLLRLAGGLSVLLILVVVNAFLHSEGSPLNPIAEAAQRTSRMPGARSRIEAIYTVAGADRSFTATGSGIYNARTGRTRAVLSVPTPQLGTIRMESVGNERTVYLRSNVFDGELPPGREWMAIQPLLGHDQETALAGNGPDDQLSMLRSVSGDVEDRGRERVGKAQTQRYAATISLADVADREEGEGRGDLAREYRQLDEMIGAPIEAEVWVDEHGIVRRTRTVMQLPSAGGQQITMDMRTDLYDFGVAPKIAFPHPDAVFDATPIARAQLHMLDGATLAHLIRPSKSAPLGGAQFRRRSNRLCRSAAARFKAVVKRNAPVIESLKRAESAGAGLKASASRYGLDVFEPLYRFGRGYLQRAGRISPPARLGGLYRRYLRNFAVQAEIFLAEARIMEIGAFQSAKGLHDRQERLSKASDALARQLGLPGCISDDHSSPGAAA